MQDEWDYVHIISGEDYPVVAPKEMARRLEGVDEIFTQPFLAIDRSYIANKWYSYRWPYTYFHGNYKNKFTRYVNIACVCLQMLIPPCKRYGIGGIETVYHSMVWGTFPRDAMEYVLDYLDNNPAYLKDLRTCKVPEELCVSTILMNNPTYRDRIHGHYLRYWHMQPGFWGPPYLDDQDIEPVKTSNAFWARKVKFGTPFAAFLRDRVNGRL